VTVSSISTTIGEVGLSEYCLTVGGRRWSFLHTGAVLTVEQEMQYLDRARDRLPYGAMLWPASIALARELLAEADELRGKRVLELGAGTGIPGIVAATLGARVLQIDRSEIALHLCARNKERNRATTLEVREAEWDAFQSDTQFDLILGSDVLYADTMHPRLRAICDDYLAAGGKVLFSDPLRSQALPMLEAMAASGWRVSVSKWSIEVDSGVRAIAVYRAMRQSRYSEWPGNGAPCL
jgi:methyltransferase-like protein 23